MVDHDFAAKVAKRIFGQPLVMNVFRGSVVEEIVATALGSDWLLCSADYAPHDLQHGTRGWRIQVKQSAALQSWGTITAKPSFSIGYKKGRYENGTTYIEEVSRNADIFIFGWHPIADEMANHLDADQWRFFVVAEKNLPQTASISLRTLLRMTSPVDWTGLPNAVSAACGTLTS